MLVKTKGIVISETNYSETSKIINVLTSDYGKIGIMAKGARNMKSPIRSVSQKLVYGEFTIKYKEKGLSNLIEVSVINSLKNITTNFKAATYTFYLVDLFNQVLKDDVFTNNKNNEIFNLLESSLLKINDGLNPELVVNIVELQLLKYLGVSLELNKCVNCGNKDNIVTINLDTLNRFEDGAEVTVESLMNMGIVKNPRDGVKVLGNGELTKKLDVKLSAFSASAVEKIQALGGKAEVI